MSQGVEWALHNCVSLSWIDPARAVPVAKLAEINDLPAPYLNKQLQALVAAGILTSTRGPHGGFALARPADHITVLDVVLAIEGDQEAFRCMEIRQQGALAAAKEDCRLPCQIASTMRAAEMAWRDSLRSRTIADVAAEVVEVSPLVPDRTREFLVEDQRGLRPPTLDR